MSIYIDRKYLLLVSSRLRNFKQKKDDLFNFSCPFCGDSKKNKLKSRGYIYRKNNDYFYICHNCSVSTTFSKFLNNIDLEYFRQYSLDRYLDGETGTANYKKPVIKLVGRTMFDKVFVKKSVKLIKNDKCQTINSLSDGHYAKEYIRKRMIPEKFWDEIFFTEKYKDLLDEMFPNHGKDNIPNDDRIVLFYTNQNAEITNVSGRALSETNVRYCTVKITDEKKLFGMHRLSFDDKIYVLEGQFDSFFIPNSIASGDSNLGGVAQSLNNKECVLVFDNEPRNKEIVKQINRAIEDGYNVTLFPDAVPYKDINDMIINGMSADEIKKIIDDNTYQGLTAKIKFIEWKKC